MEHCGLCPEFPCEPLIENYQACLGEGPPTAVFRIGDLAVRARLGTTEWVRRKREGSLPWTWIGKLQAEVSNGTERRHYCRGKGLWTVQVSFLPGPEAFGLSRIEAACRNMSPIGLMLQLPENVADGFQALNRTGKPMEVEGVFPTMTGGRPFSGKVIWHNLERASREQGLQVGISLV